MAFKDTMDRFLESDFFKILFNTVVFRLSIKLLPPSFQKLSLVRMYRCCDYI